jgi:myo-inositol-1(or 4)-monophosphatase
LSRSIAVAIEGIVVVGIVHNPILSETYVATLGGGSFKNGKRITTSTTTLLQNSLVSFGFGYDRSSLEQEMKYLQSALTECREVRRIGAAALDLCLVAEGKLDVYFETSIRQWDYAAGSLILNEAGGIISSLNDKEFHLGMTNLVAASNTELLYKFLAILH